MNFNTKMVSKITGATKRQLDHWDRTFLIKPSVMEASGYGSVRLYSFNDLIQIKVVKTLKDAGISLQKIRKAIWWLKTNMPDIDKPLLNLKFVTDGVNIFVITGYSKEIIDVLNQGQCVFSVALGQIIEELKGELKALNNERRYEVRLMGKNYSVILHTDAEDGGYWVECPELPGCATQGDTIEEALTMIRDAIGGYIDVAEKTVKTRKTV